MKPVQPPLLPRQKTTRLVGLAGIVAVLAATRFAPLSSLSSICGFQNLTGLPCPLCGGTRSAQALLQGNFPHAMYLNPIALPAVALLMAFAAVFLIEVIRGRALTDWKAVNRRISPFIPLGVVLILLWWIPQIYGALHTPKVELLNLNKPIARAAYERFAPKK